MKALCKFVKEGKTEVIPAAFHVQDDKGRWIGCEVCLYHGDMIAQDASVRSGYDVEPGHYYFARVQMTKDGKAWGASQADMRFVSVVERIAYVEKTVTARRKAAQKKFPVAA